MPVEPMSHEELARRAAGLGFKTTAADYRKIDNRLKSLNAVLDGVRGIDIAGCEPAGTFVPSPPPARGRG